MQPWSAEEFILNRPQHLTIAMTNRNTYALNRRHITTSSILI